MTRLRETISTPYATVVFTDGTTTYIAKAPTGTALSAASWQCMKLDEATASGIITWADGDANFSHQADALSSLSYT